MLRGLYYETALAGSRNSLLPTLEVTSADHVLYGTDWLAAPEPTVVRNNDQLLRAGVFTCQQLDAVQRANAAALFPDSPYSRYRLPVDAEQVVRLTATARGERNQPCPWLRVPARGGAVGRGLA